FAGAQGDQTARRELVSTRRNRIGSNLLFEAGHAAAEKLARIEFGKGGGGSKTLWRTRIRDRFRGEAVGKRSRGIKVVHKNAQARQKAHSELVTALKGMGPGGYKHPTPTGVAWVPLHSRVLKS